MQSLKLGTALALVLALALELAPALALSSTLAPPSTQALALEMALAVSPALAVFPVLAYALALVPVMAQPISEAWAGGVVFLELGPVSAPSPVRLLALLLNTVPGQLQRWCWRGRGQKSVPQQYAGKCLPCASLQRWPQVR